MNLRLRLLALSLLALLAAAAPAFAVCTTCGPNNSLTWISPTTNTDGSALVDFGGFEVRIANGATGACTATTGVLIKDVGNLGVPLAPAPNTKVLVKLGTLGLTNGQKNAVVIAYDTTGNRSACSNEAPFVFDGISPGATTTPMTE